jgi:hypothetical protein
MGAREKKGAEDRFENSDEMRPILAFWPADGQCLDEQRMAR